MFSNLIFLAIALLIVTMGPEAPSSATGYSALADFLLGIGVYTITLATIVIQNYTLKSRGKQGIPRLLFIANIELLSFLATFYFYFAGERILLSVPFAGETLSFQVIFSLMLYFLGLALFYYSAYPYFGGSRTAYVRTPLQFLIPFAIPFVSFSLLTDLLNALTKNIPHTTLEWISPTALSLTFIVGMLIFFLLS